MPIVFSNYSVNIPPNPPPVFVADFYVATNGNNTWSGTLPAPNAGNTDGPWLTIQKAVDTIGNGKLCYVRGGTYATGATISVGSDGAAGALKKIWAYPNETPIIDAGGFGTALSDATNGSAFLINSHNYWHLKGLRFTNAAVDGCVVYLTASHNIIELCVADHNGRLTTSEGKGFFGVGTGGDNQWINNDSHHNKDQSTNADNADGFQISMQGSGIVLRGNRAWFNSDDGFDFFNVQDGTTLGNYLVENNWSWRNGYDDPSLTHLGNGSGFKLGGVRSGSGSITGAHTVRQNLAFENWGNAISANGINEGDEQAMTVYNNGTYSNGGNSYIFLFAAHTIRNNYEYADGGGVALSGSATEDHNSWDVAVGVTVADASFQSVDFSSMAGPRQADGSLPVLTFLRLAAPSAPNNLRDKGVNVGLPFTGSAPDLGPFES